MIPKSTSFLICDSNQKFKSKTNPKPTEDELTETQAKIYYYYCITPQARGVKEKNLARPSTHRFYKNTQSSKLGFELASQDTDSNTE